MTSSTCRARLSLAIAAGVASLVPAGASQTRASDPLVIFQPAVTMTPDDYARLGRDQAVVKMLPTHGGQIGAFTAVRTKAGGASALAWLRNICALKQGPYIKACGRFSNPPRLEDLDALQLDDSDLTDIRRCRPNDCGFKSTAAELKGLQATIASSGPNWKPQLQTAFRQMLLERVVRHLAAKSDAPPMQPLTSGDGFGRFAELYEFRWRPAPAVNPHGRRTIDVPGGEPFMYWSKEQFTGKPIVGIMDITLARPPLGAASSAIAASTQIYASHYIDGSVGITAVVPSGDGAWSYLVYMNRSDLDILSGFWSGLTRIIMSRRIKNESAELLLSIRRRMEQEPK